MSTSLVLAVALLTSPAHTIPPSLAGQAPADEYFGRLRMSAIAIRLRIDRLGRRYAARTESDADLMHDAGDVLAALDAWIERYPHDSWAAPTEYHLGQLYEEIQTPTARVRARAVFAKVAATYPSTRFGRLARLRLTQGFPPLHVESPVVASSASPAASGASPSSSPSSPSSSPSSPSSSPSSPSPSASPFSSPNPSPSAAPSTSAPRPSTTTSPMNAP